MPEYVTVNAACLEPRLSAAQFRSLSHHPAAIPAEGVLAFRAASAVATQFHAQFAACPGDVSYEPPASPEPVSPVSRPAIVLRPDFPAYNGYQGQGLWRELHEEQHPTEATVESVVARVCIHCRDRARSLLATRPPRFETLEAYRRWSVEFHDAVNAEIGNPALGWARAVEQYGW